MQTQVQWRPSWRPLLELKIEAEKVGHDEDHEVDNKTRKLIHRHDMLNCKIKTDSDVGLAALNLKARLLRRLHFGALS